MKDDLISDEIKLKPCPFCGSRYINMNYIREDDVLEGAYVECANCGVSTRIYDE